MRFGVFNLMPLRDTAKAPAKILDETLEMVQLAEQLDFDCAWFAEHHFGNYCMCPSPLMMAAYCAGKTSRIRLGTGILVLPLYHPLRLLQEIGLVDQLSNGRLVAGIGSGYQDYEFSRYEVPLSERWPRTHEMLDIMEMAFEHGRVEYDGLFYKVPETPIALRPREDIQIYIAGSEPEMLQRAAKRGYIPFATVGSAPPAVLATIREHIEKNFAEAGVTGGVPFAIQRMVYVTDDKADALKAAEERLYTDRLVAAFRDGREILNGWELVAQPYETEASPERIVETNIVGSPEACAEKIVNEIRLLKPTDYSCFVQMGGMEGASALKALERFGTEVLPLVKKTLGGQAVTAPRDEAPSARLAH